MEQTDNTATLQKYNQLMYTIAFIDSRQKYINNLLNQVCKLGFLKLL